jgi:hypothetical protein
LPRIASAAFLRAESHGTHEHIYCAYFWDSPNLKGRVHVFISPKEQGNPVIPRALGWTTNAKVKVMLRLTDSQSVGLGVKFTLVLVTRYNFLSESCCVVSVGAPSLTRGRVCLLSVISSGLEPETCRFVA